MRQIAAAARHPLEWSQPKLMLMEYELRSGEDLVAKLRIHSSFGTLATGESGDGCWTFKRVGFWRQRVSVRACGSEADVATFQNQTWSSGGTLEFPSGRRFRATTNFWKTKLEFLDESEKPLVRLDYGGVFRLHADVEISKDALDLHELPVLVLMAWYLAVMLHRDESGAAAAAAAAG